MARRGHDEDAPTPTIGLPTKSELADHKLNSEVQMVDADSSVKDVMNADASVCNLALLMLHKSWNMVYSPSQAIELSKATIDVCMKRRTLLNMQLGDASQKGSQIPSGNGTLSPYV